MDVTNEIERAIRETEVYPVRLIRHWTDETHEYSIFEESERVGPLPMSDRTPPMILYLSDEDAKAAASQLEIYVGPEVELDLDRRDE